MKRPEPKPYNFDENMADPFGQKKGGGVQNSPVKSNPMGGGGGYSQPRSNVQNFDDNMADPFNQKKGGGGGVQNSPVRSDPMANGGGYSQPKANFHDELANPSAGPVD